MLIELSKQTKGITMTNEDRLVFRAYAECAQNTLTQRIKNCVRIQMEKHYPLIELENALWRSETYKRSAKGDASFIFRICEHRNKEVLTKFLSDEIELHVAKNRTHRKRPIPTIQEVYWMALHKVVSIGVKNWGYGLEKFQWDIKKAYDFHRRAA